MNNKNEKEMNNKQSANAKYDYILNNKRQLVVKLYRFDDCRIPYCVHVPPTPVVSESLRIRYGHILNNNKILVVELQRYNKSAVPINNRNVFVNNKRQSKSKMPERRKKKKTVMHEN